MPKCKWFLVSLHCSMLQCRRLDDIHYSIHSPFPFVLSRTDETQQHCRRIFMDIFGFLSTSGQVACHDFDAQVIFSKCIFHSRTINILLYFLLFFFRFFSFGTWFFIGFPAFQWIFKIPPKPVCSHRMCSRELYNVRFALFTRENISILSSHFVCVYVCIESVPISLLSIFIIVETMAKSAENHINS